MVEAPAAVPLALQQRGESRPFACASRLQFGEHILGLQPMVGADAVRGDVSFLDHLHQRGSRDAQDLGRARRSQFLRNRGDRDGATASHGVQHLLENTSDLGGHRARGFPGALDDQGALWTLQLREHVASL